MITTTGVYPHAALLAAIQAVGIANVMFSTDYPMPAARTAVQFLDTAFPGPAPANLARAARGNADRAPRLPAGPCFGKAPHHVRKAQDRRRQNWPLCSAGSSCLWSLAMQNGGFVRGLRLLAALCSCRQQ